MSVIASNRRLNFTARFYWISCCEIHFVIKSQPVDTQGHSCPRYCLFFLFARDGTAWCYYKIIHNTYHRNVATCYIRFATYTTVNISIVCHYVSYAVHIFNYSHAIIATLLVIIRAMSEGVKRAWFFSWIIYSREGINVLVLCNRQVVYGPQ